MADFIGLWFIISLFGWFYMFASYITDTLNVDDHIRIKDIIVMIIFLPMSLVLLSVYGIAVACEYMVETKFIKRIRDFLNKEVI